MSKKTLTNTFLSMFTAELAMLMEAGLTVTESIVIMLEDNSGKEEQELFKAMLEVLELNEPFSEALISVEVFPRYMIHMVKTGEKTGRLVESLNALSVYYDRQEALSATIKSSVISPAVLLVLMIVVVLILIVQVLPMFYDMFGRLGAQMSPLAMNLMQFGIWVGNLSVVIAIILSVIAALLFIAWLLPSARRGIHKFFMDRFGGRGLSGQIATSRFVSAMSLSLASGLDVQDAVENAAALSGGNKSIDKKHQKCLELLTSGSSLSDALLNAGILNRQDSKMLSVGARSGKMELAMAEVARRNERKTQDKIDRVVGKVEPTLVMISSVIIGVILLSVMLPLMGIMTAIG